MKLSLLLRCGVQRVPDIDAASRGPQPGQAQRGSELIGKLLEVVELVDVLPRHDDRDLRIPETGIRQVLQGRNGRVEGTLTAHTVIDVSRRPIQGYLNVDVVRRG